MPKLTYSPATGLVSKAGSGVELGGNSVSGGLSKVFTVATGNVANAGDLTLTAADCGCIVSLTDTRTGVALVLPTAADNPGWWCDIVVTTPTGNGAHNVAVTGGTFELIEMVKSTTAEAADQGTTLTINSNNDTAGDRCRVISDGTHYIARARSSTAACFTAA